VLEYTSAVRNSTGSTDANLLESIQQMFTARCFSRFSSHVNYSYAYDSDCLKLYNLLNKKYHFQALYLI
jgi:hypothetical protein